MATPHVIRADSIPAEMTVPVVIVGAGACGLTAAITLRDRGIDCLLLERDHQPAGSTALSSGFIPAAGTEAQRAAGIEDDAERFADDIIAKSNGRAARHLVVAYTRAIAEALDGLQARHGVDFTVLDGFLYPGHGVRRMHAVAERSGVALMARLERAAIAAGALLATDALVRELWLRPDDRVLGVGVERPDGRIEHIGCTDLLLACNGFGGNPALVAELLPAMRDAPFAGHVGNDGSAIHWGRELGAAVADLGGYQGHGGWAVPAGILVTWAVIMAGGVQINARGERFHDESHGYSEAAVDVLAQPGGTAWMVFDEAILTLARGFPDFREAEAIGAVRTAADTAALAGLIGCDATTLSATLDGIGHAPDRFGRRFQRPLAAPWYAIRVTGALFHTQGGLDIDARCRVRRPDGSVFEHLAAAGGAARGVSGDTVEGYLSGNGLLSAVAGGYIAGRTLGN